MANLRVIADRVRPSVGALLATELRHNPDGRVRQAARVNIRASANGLRHGSGILERLLDRKTLRVVNGEYSLDTGFVDVFDGVPEAC